MTTSDHNLKQSVFPTPEQEDEPIQAQGHGLHSWSNDPEISSDREDFLFRARSGQLQKQLEEAKEAKEARGNISDTNSNSRPKTYFAIFTGRQRYLEILFRYVTKFLDEGLIDEVHLWDFCRKTEDADYIAGVVKMDPRFVIKGNGKKLRKIVRYQLPAITKQRTEECLAGQLPPWVRVGYYCNVELLKLHILWKTMTHKMFPLFYQYYAVNLADDDILVKCDDDVLYIDNLRPLIDYARDNPDISITYPSIVNNELSAHFQMRENMIPDPRGSLLYNERWELHEELVEIFTTLSYHDFYQEFSEEDYGPKLRTAWFQTYAAAWFLHDSFLKDRHRFQSEAVYHFEAPTRVSINMFAMRGETCRVFFNQSDFATDRLNDDEEALTWRMQKAFGTTNAFFFNTTCVHYSFSRQLVDLDNANKTFIYDYAQLALEMGNEPLYQPDNTLYYGDNMGNDSNPRNLIIGKASVQIEALKALASLKQGGLNELATKAKAQRAKNRAVNGKQPGNGQGMQTKPLQNGINTPQNGMQKKPPQNGMHPPQNGMQNNPLLNGMHPPQNGMQKKPPQNGMWPQNGQQTQNGQSQKPSGQGQKPAQQNGNLNQGQKPPQNNQGQKPPQNNQGLKLPQNAQGRNPPQQQNLGQKPLQQNGYGQGQNQPNAMKQTQNSQNPGQNTQGIKQNNYQKQSQNQQNQNGQAMNLQQMHNSEAAQAATQSFLQSISAGPAR